MKTQVKIIITLVFSFLIVLFFFVRSNGSNNLQNVNEVSALIDTVNYLSEWDSSDQYRITPFLAKARFVLEKKDITLVTQCSRSKLLTLVKLVDVWQGPISIAVFAQTPEVLDILKQIATLRKCHHNLAVYVSFHLVTFGGNGNYKYPPSEVIDCSSLPDLEADDEKYHNYELTVEYPINLMRNVARKGIQSQYFFLIDIDMVPSSGMRHSFLYFLKNFEPGNKTVYIVPAFELADHVPVPKTKENLKKFVEKGIMRSFYAELCSKCHACVDYFTWLQLPSRTGLAVAFSTQWQDPCEPFYVAMANVPLYDESFKQYGFNRISQVCELHVAGYLFSVLDNAFITHIGMKVIGNFHETKEIEQEKNRKRFREFKQNLLFKYPDSNRRC